MRMRNLTNPLPAEQPLSAITAEGATLPVIRAAGFEARVNAYVLGATERLRRRAPVLPPSPTSPVTQGATLASNSPGCAGGATDLWYLSLVAPRGHGTTLRAIWANLVGNTHHAVWLEGVGMVALGHQRLDLNGSTSDTGGLGYPIHWTYRQVSVPPSRAVQAVLESDLLTCYDPLLIPAVTRAPRTARGNVGLRGVSTPTRPERLERGAATLTSFASAGSAQEDETRARETHPLFLLLVRSGTVGKPERVEQDSATHASECWLAQLHLRYLAARVPWLPYYPAWAEYLWQRALARGEAEPLVVWSYGATGDGTAENSLTDLSERALSEKVETPSARSAPYLAAAYLCRPDPLALTADLSHAVAAGKFNLERTDGVALDAPSEDERAA